MPVTLAKKFLSESGNWMRARHLQEHESSDRNTEQERSDCTLLCSHSTVCAPVPQLLFLKSSEANYGNYQ